MPFSQRRSAAVIGAGAWLVVAASVAVTATWPAPSPTPPPQAAAAAATVISSAASAARVLACLEVVSQCRAAPCGVALAHEALPLLANIPDIGVVASPPPAGAPLAGSFHPSL